MSARSRTAGGIADRHALLSAYGYGAPPPAQPPLGRTASPFEDPYSQPSSSSSSSLPPRFDAKKHDDAPPPAATGKPWGGWGTQSRLAEQLEEGNDARLEGLSDRVKILKNITMGIGQEVREGTADLSTLSEAMSNAGALLGNTFTKMNKMARRQGGWWCNMMLFLLFVCWLFVSSSRGRGGKKCPCVEGAY
ncbi:hypothetical protein BDZ90DRAFT_224731 [Jaminaea rosea]|uniref:t-SNARE coiled-coil homology domain-containing protein n=1 Tax=Jaminaea rosea TaxID=1569628 RepID=A0A316UGH8_9BASI|nr:hypothetical protein BDZ90DRAFT_224731 [Jaminaea rosea]PWN24372.1 hypothetical protein BDZ90DRAFT_224731 [Jaminaea rosea]